MDELTKAEQETLVSLLSKIQPGFYPIELFWQLTRLTTAATFEIVPLVSGPEGMQVLLYARGADDKHWPSKLHIPGCIVRPEDKGEDTLQRIIDTEMAGVDIAQIHFVTTQVRKTLRGNELAAIYVCELAEKPRNGELYSIDKLPKSLIPVYPSIISQAAILYKAANQPAPSS